MIGAIITVLLPFGCGSDFGRSVKPLSKSKIAFLSKLAISLCNFELIKAEGLPEGEGADGIEFGAAVDGEDVLMGVGVFEGKGNGGGVSGERPGAGVGEGLEVG